MQEGDLYTGQELKKGWTTKTNGLCQEIIIKDMDYYDEDGKFKKQRRKATNITPKKKKRK